MTLPRDHMLEYLYGELNAEERAAFEAQLARSETDRRELAALRTMLEISRKALALESDPPPPARVRHQLLAAAAAQAKLAAPDHTALLPGSAGQGDQASLQLGAARRARADAGVDGMEREPGGGRLPLRAAELSSSAHVAPEELPRARKRRSRWQRAPWILPPLAMAAAAALAVLSKNAPLDPDRAERSIERERASGLPPVAFPAPEPEKGAQAALPQAPAAAAPTVSPQAVSPLPGEGAAPLPRGSAVEGSGEVPARGAAERSAGSAMAEDESRASPAKPVRPRTDPSPGAAGFAVPPAGWSSARKTEAPQSESPAATSDSVAPSRAPARAASAPASHGVPAERESAAAETESAAPSRRVPVAREGAAPQPQSPAATSGAAVSRKSAAEKGEAPASSRGMADAREGAAPQLPSPAATSGAAVARKSAAPQGEAPASSRGIADAREGAAPQPQSPAATSGAAVARESAAPHGEAAAFSRGTAAEREGAAPQSAAAAADASRRMRASDAVAAVDAEAVSEQQLPPAPTRAETTPARAPQPSAATPDPPRPILGVSELEARAKQHAGAARWTQAAADYRELLRRFPRHSHANTWREQLTAALRAQLPTKPATR